MDRGAAQSLHDFALGLAALDRLVDRHRAQGPRQGREVATRALLCGVPDLLRNLGAALERFGGFGCPPEVAQHESLVSKRVREA